MERTADVKEFREKTGQLIRNEIKREKKGGATDNQFTRQNPNEWAPWIDLVG
jgi:hypothetical protein